MKTIDIRTTQNVAISYELASLSNRVFAWLIDMVIIIIAYLMLFAASGLFLSSENSLVVAWYLLFLPVFFFYTLVWEWATGGSTPGKMAMKIRVVRLDGRPLSFTDHLLRWSFRMVDIYFSLGSIAITLINSTDWCQRLGDMIANTSVIRLQSSLSISLKDILHIKTRDNYDPVYQRVKYLEEEDMLLVKKVLERHSKFPNESHHQALQLAAQKMARFLQLNDVPENEREFLNTCIRDYIVLTR